MHNSTAILVLGMPRSGTSAVTRVLNLHGAVLSENLLPAADANPKGFFESADALAIHERLLSSLGRSWFDIGEMPDGWVDFSETQQAHRELEALIQRDYRGETIWIVKEPRMCRFLPLWLRVLEGLCINPKAVLVTRHPDEVVNSIAAMVGDGQWSSDHTKILWLEYFFEAEKASRQIPRALITYDHLLTDWEAHVNRIAAELDIVWPNSSDSIRSEVDLYLNSENRHHDYFLSYDEGIGEFSLAEKTYMICHEMKEGYWTALEAMNSSFSAMLAFFHRPMHDLVRRVAEHYSNIALAQKIQFDELSNDSKNALQAKQFELDELKVKNDSLQIAQQVQLEDLRRHNESVCLSHQAELDELKGYYNALQFSQESELSKQHDLIGMQEAELSRLKRELAELESTTGKLFADLSALQAREESAHQILLETQGNYAELKSLTSQKAWLIKAFLSRIVKNE
ncbi:sulfotransferase [Pseudomonas sp. LY-1]